MCEKAIKVILNESASVSQTGRITVKGLVQPFSLEFYERPNAANVERMVSPCKSYVPEELVCCERSDPCITASSTSRSL